ncbi:hypoxanthine phosphoribosyltransferase [Colwellia sp. TT2012]|uniref:hypoxanthine phosphoribosyltransferase n=1 Tax=Colwellia sp. TT2012 TaxID=1720342 RepID=UPI00070B62C2|nr:hypoxanthine phosphoribosyltransferase [Colwellia sp. TT2012]
MKHTIEVMISEEQIKTRASQLGQQISEHYQDSDNLVMIGLLRGSFVFMADLTRAISVNHSVDFMTASSYGNNTESSRDVHIRKDLDDNIEGKDVLLVEDIIDTGNTLSKVLQILNLRGPNSIQICTLLDKPTRRKKHVDVKWVGFEIADEFVVGVGIDYAQKYRQLPYIPVTIQSARFQWEFK